MRVIVTRTPEDAAAAAARLLACTIDTGRAERRRVHIALAGGSTPQRAYELLAGTVADWRDVELWFGDERAVAPEDPESNYAMVRAALLDRVAIPAANVHRIAAETGVERAAAAYAAELRACVPAGERDIPVLDLALLGLGEDGHTASLFPGDPAVDAPEGTLCAAVHGAPKPPPERVTLTLDVLGAARQTAVLAVGAAKAAAVARVLAGPDRATPASLVAGPRAELIVDAAAAPPGAD